MYNRIVDNQWDYRCADTKEYTHRYHTYPAMMIPQVARQLIKEYHPEGGCSLIFDPYMGSGTTLVESMLVNVNSIGTDLNPLACLMAKVKTTHYNEDIINAATYTIERDLSLYDPSLVFKKDYSNISNVSFWYSDDTLLKLSYIEQILCKLPLEIIPFFKIALSEVVREASYTRNSEFKRFRMSLESMANFHPDVFGLFMSKVCRNIEGLVEFNKCAGDVSAKVCNFNTVNGVPVEYIQEGTIDMVVTSPPYGDSSTTVAYGQFSRWANEWFEFPHAKNLDKILMGGESRKEFTVKSEVIYDELSEIEKIDVSRYKQVMSFLQDYSQSIHNVSKCLRKGGRVCYVVGNRTVKGVQISLDYFTAEQFEKEGFSYDTTIVREIPNKRMPSKNSPTNKTGVKSKTMSNEYIVILTKYK